MNDPRNSLPGVEQGIRSVLEEASDHDSQTGKHRVLNGLENRWRRFREQERWQQVTAGFVKGSMLLLVALIALVVAQHLRPESGESESLVEMEYNAYVQPVVFLPSDPLAAVEIGEIPE